MSNNIKPRSWDDIRSFYKELIDIDIRYENMVMLIDFVESTGLNKRLYGYTSLADLIIGIYDPITPNIEVLRVSFDRNSGLWRLSFQPDPYSKAEHDRQYKDNLVEHFSNYISWLKW